MVSAVGNRRPQTPASKIGNVNGGKPAGTDYQILYNPEFLREGSAIQDFTHPDRVLIGCDDERGFGRGTAVFEPFIVYGQILPGGFFLYNVVQENQRVCSSMPMTVHTFTYMWMGGEKLTGG